MGSRVLILLATVLVLALAASLGVVNRNLEADILERRAQELRRAKATFRSGENQRFAVLASLVRTVETNPALRVILNRTDQATLTSFLEDIQLESGVDFIVMTDLEGRMLAATSEGVRDGLYDHESVLLALDGEEAAGYWLHSQSLYQVYSVPLTIAGGLVEGSVTVAYHVSPEMLSRLAEETGVELAVWSRGEVLAASFQGSADERLESTRLHLSGLSQTALVILQDLAPSARLLAQTRRQLGLVGVVILLLALGLSIPLVGRVTVPSELLETVVETVREGLVHLGSQGEVLLINPEGERLLGVEPGQVTGKTLLDQVLFRASPDGSSLTTSDLKQPLRSDDGQARSASRSFPISLVISPIEEDGEFKGAVMVFRDITQVKETQRELREAVLEAEKASQAKADFLAHMSHEIRTPMNGVLGMNQLLQTTSLTPLQARYARTIEHSAEALLSVINDVLDLSKLEADRFELESLSFSPLEVVEQICSLLLNGVIFLNFSGECYNLVKFQR